MNLQLKNKFWLLTNVLLLVLAIPGCGSLNKTATVETLKANAQSTASVLIARDYVEVYRDIMRMDELCLAYRLPTYNYPITTYSNGQAITIQATGGGEFRQTSSKLDREQKIGEVFARASTGSYLVYIRIKEIPPLSANIEIWATRVQYNKWAEVWGKGITACPKGPVTATTPLPDPTE